MKRIIRLTDSDLIKLVKRVISESNDDTYKLFGVDVKLDKDDDKLTESQEKIREKIIDIIIGKTKRYYGED